jgi:uncharacterized repeat protein (TIGR01451 family)
MRSRTLVIAGTPLVTAAALLCLATAPVAVVAAEPHLTLAKTVDRAVATLGRTLTYTVTVGNTGTGAAQSVTVDDVLGGDAGYLVNDGTAGTANSFAGSAVVTVTRISPGHYRWTYPTVKPGDVDIVRFSAVITRPAVLPPQSRGSVVLTNSASSDGLQSVTVRTTAPLGEGVKGSSTGTPGTGAGEAAVPAIFLFLGGLGVILLTEHTTGRERGARNLRRQQVSGVAPRRGPSR